jgi:hypothetical protein
MISPTAFALIQNAFWPIKRNEKHGEHCIAWVIEEHRGKWKITFNLHDLDPSSFFWNPTFT